MRLKTLNVIVGVVLYVIHADTMVQWLISVQPSHFKTSNSIDKSIERFRVNITLGVSPLFLVRLWPEVPCLVSITTNNINLLSQANKIHDSVLFTRLAPVYTIVNMDNTCVHVSLPQKGNKLASITHLVNSPFACWTAFVTFVALLAFS